MHRQFTQWVICALAVSTITTANAQHDGIKFGSVAMDVPAAMHKRLTPLTPYLSEVLGQPVSLKLSKNMRIHKDMI